MLAQAELSGDVTIAEAIRDQSEVIEDAGFVFKRGDVLDLQRMLSLLCRMCDFAKLPAGAPSKRVRQHYLWEKAATEIDAVYAEVMLRGEKRRQQVRASSWQ